MMRSTLCGGVYVVVACVFAVTTAAGTQNELLARAGFILNAPVKNELQRPGSGACLATAFSEHVAHNGGQAGPEETLADYIFDPPKDGCYSVEEYHPATGCAELPAGPTPIRIEYCKGRVAMGLVDQGRDGGQWNLLTQLPFYVGHQGQISITQKGFPTEVCPGNDCLYMADAFRLTWIGETCDPGAAGAPASAQHSAVRAKLEQELQEQQQQQSSSQPFSIPGGDASQVEMQTAAEAVASLGTMAYQTVVNGFEDDRKAHVDDHVRFAFTAPKDGCYMVEEWHPHVLRTTAVPYQSPKSVPYVVNYCKGRSMAALVDHTDGRHGQWNYMAHLPYYDDEKDAGVLVPRRVALGPDVEPTYVGRSTYAEHAFRYTYVGPKCSAEAAQVHRMALRITADFEKVKDRLPAFKKMLREAVASRAGVAMERLLVSHVRQGSVIAELTVLPAAVHPAGINPSSQHSAFDAVVAVEEALTTKPDSGLGKELCGLVDAGADDGCDVRVIAKGKAPPLVTRPTVVDGQDTPTQQQQQQQQQQEFNVYDVMVVLPALGLLATGISAYILHRRRRSQEPKKEEPKEEDFASVTVAVEEDPMAPTVVVAAVKKAEEDADDASTITPKSRPDEDDTQSQASIPVSETVA